MGNAHGCMNYACYVYKNNVKIGRKENKLTRFLEKCRDNYNDIFHIVSDIKDANIIFVIMDSECMNNFELNKFLIQTQHIKTLFVYLDYEYYDKKKINQIYIEDQLSVNIEKFTFFLNKN